MDDFFGFSVSLSGDRALIGAYRDDDGGDRTGSAYVFVRSGTTWSQEAKLTASDAQPVDLFGRAVSLSGDRALVGSYFNDNPDNPLPQIGRDVGTSLLGLFAALDVAEGPVDISAVGQVGGQTVSLGWYRARVFPGAITSVTLYGLRSHQVPAD